MPPVARGRGGRGRAGGSRGRGRGGAGGRGGGRGGRGGAGRARTASPALKRGRFEATEEPANTGEMSELSGAFFSDLSGVRPRAAPRADDNGHRPLETGPSSSSLESALTLPGESLRTAQTEGSQQTQDKVMWLELGLCKSLVRAVSHLGFMSPTPVQAQAIPAVLSGADVCARAVTGSGKTGAFLLPVAHMLLTRPPQMATTLNSKRRFIRAVVLLPTRELGVQCQSMLTQLLQFTTGLTVALAIGGIAASTQEAALQAVPDILIATPGRLVDFARNFNKGAGLDLSGVELLVLDECDKMLTITLRDQIVDIVDRVPEETRQMLMFSATMTDEVDTFAKDYLFKPRNIDVGHVALQAKLRQQFVRVRSMPAIAGAGSHAHEAEDEEETSGPAAKRIRSKRAREAARAESGEDKEALPATSIIAEQEHFTVVKSRYLVALCQYFPSGVIIFCRYRTTAHRLNLLFNTLDMSAVEIQGNQPQEERFQALERFSAGQVKYLITTDVAARGLDIKNVFTVINFDLPPTLTAYIHRVGRTARIGESGTAVSLVNDGQDADIMRKILAVSGSINEHQVASVKRRDISDRQLNEAAHKIDAAFPAVRTQLAAEALEARIAEAEKRYGTKDSFVDALTAKPKKDWVLSRGERKKRDDEARQQYEKEAEVTINRFQNELADLERQEQKSLLQQKVKRRGERERKQRDKAKLKERAKELRKKAEKKINAGAVKKLKKRKVRESIRDRRAADREKKGISPFKHGEGRKRNKKARHSKGIKKH